MNALDKQRKQNANELLAALPQSAEFHLHRIDQDVYELRNMACVIRISYERFVSSSSVVEVVDPKLPNDGMHFLVLRHLRCADESKKDNETSFSFYGRVLATYYQDLLAGDFSVRPSYNQIEDQFWDV